MVSAANSPHSLGKLIEWKLYIGWGKTRASHFFTPHSLGKLIEWKHRLAVASNSPDILSAVAPHSLGKLIKWKPSLFQYSPHLLGEINSHSLGKLIG
jgi:hypothetical protein